MSDNPTLYGLNDGSRPLNYSANDWFYLKNGAGAICDPKNTANSPACNKNDANVRTLMSKTDTLGAAITQYNDIKVLYNRELLFTINIFVGLAMLVYYIYVNGDSLPNVRNAIGSASGSVSKMAADVTSKIPAMRPPQ